MLWNDLFIILRIADYVTMECCPISIFFCFDEIFFFVLNERQIRWRAIIYVEIILIFYWVNCPSTRQIQILTKTWSWLKKKVMKKLPKKINWNNSKLIIHFFHFWNMCQMECQRNLKILRSHCCDQCSDVGCGISSNVRNSYRGVDDHDGGSSGSLRSQRNQ